MKTALAQLLDLLNKEIKSCDSDERHFQAGLQHAYNLTKDRLKKERKQIEEAYYAGASAEYGREDNVEYFNETYR